MIQAFANDSVVKINKQYKTKVIETPPYLTGTLPTGAAGFFDTFTKKPFQLYFLTTDPKRDPAKSVSQLIDLLVHEEYGHCVNHSNSVLGFGGKASDLELINDPPLGPITEGLSFNREREFLEASLALKGKAPLTKAEKDYVALLEKYGGFDLLNMEIELEVRKWRLIRFLRVIGDVRINTGKQGLFEFIDWAQSTPASRGGNIYYQLFPAHEGMFPGYATCYAVVGEEIRADRGEALGPEEEDKVLHVPDRHRVPAAERLQAEARGLRNQPHLTGFVVFNNERSNKVTLRAAYGCVSVPKTITTFGGFVKHILLLIPWLALLVLRSRSIPAYFILRVFLGIDLFHVVATAVTNPQGVANFMMQTTQSQPAESLFQFTTFPGFTFAALFSTIFMIWVERKFVAKIQLRVGPQYAGRFGGILQNFADLFKLLFKEIIIPDKADKRVFLAVPLALMFVSGALLALVPVGPDFYIANPSVGVIFVFALIGLSAR